MPHGKKLVVKKNWNSLEILTPRKQPKKGMGRAHY